MSLRFPPPRVVVELTVLALLLVDLHAFTATLQAHRAVRERALRAVEERMEAARPQLVSSSERPAPRLWARSSTRS